MGAPVTWLYPYNVPFHFTAVIVSLAIIVVIWLVMYRWVR